MDDLFVKPMMTRQEGSKKHDLTGVNVKLEPLIDAARAVPEINQRFQKKQA